MVEENGNLKLLSQHQVSRQAPSATPFLSTHLNATIKQMMEVNPDQRPNLIEVIDSLSKEQTSQRPDVETIIEKAQTEKIPMHPVFLSEYRVNPRFRRVHLNEMAFFMFVDMQPRTVTKLKRMFALLRGYFGDSYTIHEVYGRNDFIIRIWARLDRTVIKSFVDRLKGHVLEGFSEAISVMACEDIRYVGKLATKLGKAYDKTEAMILINEYQSNKNRDARDHLKREGIFIGKTVKHSKGSIRSFCLVKSIRDLDEPERLTQSALLRDTIVNAGLDLAKFDVTIYRRAYSRVDGCDNESSDHLVTYLAPTYEQVIKIPELILDHLPKQNPFRTITMLSTKRYLVECDKLFIPRAVNGRDNGSTTE